MPHLSMGATWSSTSMSRATSDGVPTPIVSPRTTSSTPSSNSRVATGSTCVGDTGPSYGQPKATEMYARTCAPAGRAPSMTVRASSSDCSIERLMLARLKLSVAATNNAMSSTPAARARSRPRGLGTSATYRTPGRLRMARKTSSASAMRGTALGCTNEVTSIHAKPASESRSTKRTLASVGMAAGSFWSPSRGPTSTMRTRRGRPPLIRLLYVLRLVRRADREQARATGDLFANLNAYVGDHASMRRLDHMLHLHRFEHHQRLVLDHVLTHFNRNPDHAAWHRRGKPPGATADAPVASGLFDSRCGRPLQTKRASLPVDYTPVVVGDFDADGLALDAEATRFERRAAQEPYAKAAF